MNRHGSLNRIYRLVWSQVTNSFVAVAENARGRGKGKNQQRKLIAAALALSAVTWLIPDALAGPTGGTVVNGSAKIIQSKNSPLTTIVQKSATTTIDWQSFNLAANETVNFVQASSNSVAINDILGNSGSTILGHINAKGDVFLINPDGIIFGQSAVVNVGGLVASALAIDSTSKLGMHFSGTGTVDNQGTISSGSHVVLLGSSVSNEGTISAPMGTVILGAGNGAMLTMNNNQVHLNIDASTLQNLISNGGLVQADGGAIIMTAGAKNELLGSVVNNTGVVQARTVGNNKGSIELLADMGSGTVNVGGTLDASATGGGDGGNITTDAAHVGVADHSTVTTHSTKGTSGTWTIDPTNFTITADNSAQTVSGIGNLTLEAALNAGNVSIATSPATNGNDQGDINVNAPVTWSNASALTLSALNNIYVNQAISVLANGTLNLQYGQSAANANNPSTVSYAAPINLASNSIFTTKLGNDATMSATTYVVVNSLGSAGVVNTGDGTLQGMTTGGNFVLGSNIDASPTGYGAWYAAGGFTPIGNDATPFTGIFNGLGHTISGLTIHQPSNTHNTGLFGIAINPAVISNINLVNANISGGADIGALLGDGENISVSNSSSSGSIVATNGSGGGLIGNSDNGSYNRLSSSANVTGPFDLGGVIGESDADGISNAVATGAIAATGSGQTIGGLVGAFGSAAGPASITNSYATGNNGINFMFTCNTQEQFSRQIDRPVPIGRSI